MYINITRAEAKNCLQVYRKAGIKSNVYTTLLNSRIERKEIEMLSNTLNSFNDEMYTIEHDSDLNTLTIRYGTFKGKIQLEKEATHGTHINLNFQIINNNSNILKMNTNSIFAGLQTARQNKTMKTFVKETKEQFNIDLSVQGIRSAGHHEGQVYNKYAAFERYAKQEQPKRDETPKATPQPKAEPKAIQKEDAATAASNALIQLVNNLNLLNEDKVIELINTHGKQLMETYASAIIEKSLKDLKVNSSRTDIYLKDIKTARVEGVTHPKFDTILRILHCGLNPYITGPAGSGKTHTAKQCAEVFNIPFYALSLSAQTSNAQIFGYMNANGNFVETDFYKAFTTGGVFVFDEIDNGNANVLAAINSALSNGICSFPNGMQEKHSDFKCVATANTTGNGATAQYVGRNQIDKATLDRFMIVNYEYDPSLELMMCNDRKDIYNMVVNARQLLKDTKAVISPRATAAIYKLNLAGMSIKDAFDLAVTNKLTDNEKQILCK